MSWRRTKERKRRRRLEQLRAEFQAKRRDPEALAEFLRRYADSERRLWAIAELPTGAEPLDEAELAMIAQIVAPHLAGMSSARRRHNRSGMDADTAWRLSSRKYQVSAVRPESSNRRSANREGNHERKRTGT